MANIEKSEELISEELSRVLKYMTETIYMENPSPTIKTEHFILAVVESRECLAYRTLNDLLSSENLNVIRTFYYDFLREKSDPSLTNPSKKYSNSLARFINDSKHYMKKIGAPKITTEHVFLAILDDDNFPVAQMFDGVGVTYSQFYNRVNDNTVERMIDDEEENENPNKNKKVNSVGKSSKPKMELVNAHQVLSRRNGNKSKTNYINAYCSNLNALAEKGKLDKLVGRETELQQIIRVLGRRTKNNAVIVGVNGCGKTKLVQGLAQLLYSGDVPVSLQKKQVLSLDLMSMLVGTQYRGVFEERIKGLFDELKNGKDYILFIDDIHNVLSSANSLGDVNIATTINDALSNGDIQVIGTTSFKGYHDTFDNNPSIARRFQKININPNTIEESIDILENIKEYYEKFHKVTYTKDAIKACVELANKYISERSLPDSAIDIMDEAGSNVINSIMEPTELRNAKKQLQSITHKKSAAAYSDNYDEVDVLSKEEEKLKLSISSLQKNWSENIGKERKSITRDDISAIVSEMTGIPTSRLNSDEKKKLASMDKILKQYIIGQDEAIDSVCRAIKRSRVGLSNINKPVSFMFIGKSGTGKTLMAKKLAREIFGDEKYLVRLDMSEYSDKTSVNKLIGSSPGYVGYENGGQLTEMIKNKKYCVLLLDEIEKADTEIYNIFLQVLDEGKLTDNTGQSVDFKNVILLMTSNVGTKEASEFGNLIGFTNEEENHKQDIMTKELKKKFPPEFINRIDEIIYFNPLSDENLNSIIQLELNNLKKRIEGIGHSLAYGDDTVDYILNIISDEKEYGARPILRAIQDEIENKITDLLLTDDYDNHIFNVMVIDNSIEIS